MVMELVEGQELTLLSPIKDLKRSLLQIYFVLDSRFHE